MKTGFVIVVMAALTVGLWMEIGVVSLLVLPVVLIFGLAAFAPLMDKRENTAAKRAADVYPVFGD